MKHDSNDFRALFLLDLIEFLENLRDKLCALVYCLRNVITCVQFLVELKVLQTDHGMKVFDIVKHFSSPKKQKDPEILKPIKTLHHSPDLELKVLDFDLCKKNLLLIITDKFSPKKPRKVGVHVQL